MIKKMTITGLSVLLLSVVSFSQINLSSMYSRFVRISGTVTTSIDTLETKTTVHNGNAITTLLIAYTPNGTLPVKNTMEEFKPDSIETTASFRLPSDFTVDSMWLWINGERVKANIQDRQLAASQYQQIVGYRQDPALLQYSGNGYYNLRIFPAFISFTRKIEIQFHHTFDEAAEGKVSATLPVSFDSTQNYYYNSGNVRVAKASFSTLDNAEYTVTFPGIGSGIFSKSAPLTLSSTNINKLGPGLISRNDPSGSNEFLWVANDPVRNKISAGMSVQIADTNVTFENEPETRIIAVDLRNSLWNWNDYYKKRAEYLGQTYSTITSYKDIDILNRMQKYVLLCLEHYLGTAKKFNIVFGGATVSTLFDQPAQANPEYIRQAIEAVLNFTPDKASSTENVITEAVKQASSGVVILISDLFDPVDYYTYDKSVYTVTANGKLYDETINRITSIVDSSEVTMFTIDDNYRLSQISYVSGGFRLGSLLNIYNIEYRFEVIDGRRVKIPIMPPLFGSRNSSGVRAIKISSNSLQDLVYTIDGYSYVWYTGDLLLERSAPYYYSYNQTSAQLYIAGQTESPIDGNVTFSIRGKLGGLKFNKTFTASTDEKTAGIEGSVQWAFRYAEEMAAINYTKLADDIKNVGMQYHIITRQTSLLALEPGVKMWKDTLYSPEQVNSWDAVPSTVRGTSEMADVAYSKEGGAPTSASGSGMDIDGISLADLASRNGISGIVSPYETVTSKAVRFSAIYNSGAIRISCANAPEKVALQLFDLRGRVVFQKVISQRDFSNSTYNWTMDTKTSGISSGFYMLHVSGGAVKQVFRLPINGRN
jgi:hypothetical protein